MRDYPVPTAGTFLPCITGVLSFSGDMTVISLKTPDRCQIAESELLEDLLYEIRQLFQSVARLHEFSHDQHLTNCILNDALTHARVLTEAFCDIGGSVQVVEIVPTFPKPNHPNAKKLYGEFCARLSHLDQKRKDGKRVWSFDDFRPTIEMSRDLLRHIAPIGDDALAFGEQLLTHRIAPTTSSGIGF